MRHYADSWEITREALEYPPKTFVLSSDTEKGQDPNFLGRPDVISSADLTGVVL
jgi:hypothetical protein